MVQVDLKIKGEVLLSSNLWPTHFNDEAIQCADILLY